MRLCSPRKSTRAHIAYCPSIRVCSARLRHAWLRQVGPCVHIDHAFSPSLQGFPRGMSRPIVGLPFRALAWDGAAPLRHRGTGTYTHTHAILACRCPSPGRSEEHTSELQSRLHL